MADPIVTLDNAHVSVQPGGQAQVVVKKSNACGSGAGIARPF
jgi:hypothetical protein